MAGQLQQTEATRRRLLSDLAHELRTPISTIQLYCEGLSDGVVQWDESSERVLTEHTNRLARLAQDIDEVSRAEEGRLELEPLPVPVADLVSSALQGQTDAFARTGVELVSRPGGATHTVVVVDPRRIGQLMDNLLRNALRHTPHGGTVLVAAYQAGDEAQIAVTDSGDGIPAHQLSHVFGLRALLPRRHRP